MGSLRKRISDEKYDEYQANGGLTGECPLCTAPVIKEFEHFKIITNIFPYDKVAEVNDMIITKRHVAERGLNNAEQEELTEVKHGYVADNYEYIIESTHHTKSIPHHFHLHLIVVRE